MRCQIGMLSNLIWIAIGFRISSLAMILGNAMVFAIHARAWWRWTPPPAG